MIRFLMPAKWISCATYSPGVHLSACTVATWAVCVRVRKFAKSSSFSHHDSASTAIAVGRFVLFAVGGLRRHTGTSGDGRRCGRAGGADNGQPDGCLRSVVGV